ncbi:MAG: hypothetical protein KY476_19550, partial [Planctomycetes bacterium]|nr:hypothetical protein [Planctomycetota bacterium]
MTNDQRTGSDGAKRSRRLSPTSGVARAVSSVRGKSQLISEPAENPAIKLIGHRSSVIGHWSLVIGHWSLVIGH